MAITFATTFSTTLEIPDLEGKATIVFRRLNAKQQAEIFAAMNKAREADDLIAMVQVNIDMLVSTIRSIDGLTCEIDGKEITPNFTSMTEADKRTFLENFPFEILEHFVNCYNSYNQKEIDKKGN